MALEETWSDMKASPAKSTVYISSLGACIYMMKKNPSEEAFKEIHFKNMAELACVGESIRNPYSEMFTLKLTEAYNSGLVRRLNLGLFSIMWCDNYDKTVDLYDARCKYLKAGWLDLPDRYIDIGFLGKWYKINEAMENFDVNPKEWLEHDERTLPPGLC